MLRAGVFLQDRYEILERIGSGGMSDVYKAMCHKLNRLVAIKVLKDEFCSDSSFIAQFKLEAQSAARLAHPNIVSVYDVVDEGNLHYIVMELVEGITLKNYISKKGHLDIKEAIGIAIQMAQGMAAAHEQNIVHRDIKPQNIIISRDGKVKVADFGIARAASAQTMSTTAIGSVHYISPEQARGGYSDARSDIYSLGVTIFEMVTGRVPFEGENTVAIALAHLEDPIPLPSAINPKVPVSLEKIILKCTEKKPEFRYSSAVEVINDLRRALVEPDEDFVQLMPGVDNTAKTVTISQGELAQIKEGSRKTGQIDLPLENIQKSGRDQREDHFREPARQDKKRKAPEKKKIMDDEDVNPQIEKILTGLGVVVAILFVAGLVFLVAKVGGLFNMGVFNKESSPSTEISEEASSSISDTQTYMPDVEGKTLEEAEKLLKEKSLQLNVREYQESEDIPEGQIISQEKKEGEVVEKYSTVYVVVSKGSSKIDLAEFNLTQLDETTATQTLTDKNLRVTIERENSDTIEKGKVIKYTPEKAAEGEMVTLTVSDGPVKEMSSVPNLLEKTEEEAIGLLADAGLVPGKTDVDNSSTVPKGQIISQDAPAGTVIEKGSAIGYVVSSGPAESTNQRYVAAINETYDLSNLIGPGSGSINVKIAIRLKQTVNGEDEYTPLMPATEISGQVLLPVSFSNIEGYPGVRDGEVQVYDVDSGAVLKSYPVTFFPQE